MKKRINPLIYVFLIVGILLIFIPLYLTVITAFKTQGEITENFFALPSSLYLGNFKAILEDSEYPRTVFNTLYITILSSVGVLLIVPMVSYAIARNMERKRYYKFLYFFLLIGIFVPFQVKMLPLVKVMSSLGMMNITGISIVYMASSVCEGVFLYVAFILGIPSDLEEAAYIDGASTFKTYTKVVFPLLSPMTATVLIKNGLWFWNDFFLPQLVLNKTKENWTLTLFQYNFKTQLFVDYTKTFTAFILSMLPVMVVYVFLQKKIIGGLTNGAVKG
mgnify:CR=1 FL=1